MVFFLDYYSEEELSGFSIAIQPFFSVIVLDLCVCEETGFFIFMRIFA